MIDSYWEALALHKTLMVANLECDLDDEYAVSPHIAAVQRRLVEAMQAAAPGSCWPRWRDGGEHEWRLPKVRVYLARLLPGMPSDLRREFVLDVLAPLQPSNAFLAELLVGAEQ